VTTSPSQEPAAAHASLPNSMTLPADGSTPPEPLPTAAVNPAALWLRRTDQIAVGLLVTALFVLLLLHWVQRSRWGSQPIELSSLQPRAYHYALDINAASWVEWAQLDGIGETLARRIVADREDRGPFQGPDDVGRVRGIGGKLLERIRPYLRGGTSGESDPVTSP